jgi:hypothetical protein
MSSYAPAATNGHAHAAERDTMQKPIGTPAPLVRVLIRRLPLNTSEESLRLMVVWSKELATVELLPVEKSEDEGFRSAILKFKTMAGAVEVKNMLDGRSNISQDADMIVDILTTSPSASSSYAAEMSPTSPSATTATTSTTPSTSGGRQASRFNSAFQSLGSVSTQSGDAFSGHVHDLSTPASASHPYSGVFSPTSPIGNHLHDRTRVSGKSLIENNLTDDDETSDLLKDPVAYAENGAGSGRRATAPQIPISRMNNLSLNTNTVGAPASVPSPYGGNLSTQLNSAPPSNGLGHGYQMNGQHFRPHFPPINPADQNPPCNTLYVGNLPLETSEEELKAMFSKQRGYKRLCFRTKHNGPMCFVEFEDISFATKALHELYGHPLHNSVKGGIRLSFSKNPLGVRTQHTSGSSHPGPMGSPINGNMNGQANNGFNTANGPPPGLSAPPGLGPARVNFNATNTNGNHAFNQNGFAGGSGYAWHGSAQGNYGMGNGNTPVNGVNGKANGQYPHNVSNALPPRMMGR